MSERAVARLSPQAQVDTRAIELVSGLQGDLNGHKEVDAIQFATVKAELTEIKTEVRQLNDDGKKGLEEVRKQQAENHRENSQKLAELINKQAGANSVWAIAAKALPILLSAGTFAFLIWGKP